MYKFVFLSVNRRKKIVFEGNPYHQNCFVSELWDNVTRVAWETKLNISNLEFASLDSETQLQFHFITQPAIL